MIKKQTYEIIAVLIVVAIVVFAWCNNKITDEYPINNLIDFFNLVQTDCGIESCHGTEIVCGKNIPQRCTEEYQGGDRCRQFVGCEKVDGNCRVKKSEKFDKCKDCVEECYRKQDDPIKFFRCEGECIVD